MLGHDAFEDAADAVVGEGAGVAGDDGFQDLLLPIRVEDRKHLLLLEPADGDGAGGALAQELHQLAVQGIDADPPVG
jgi:hypothetical protein